MNENVKQTVDLPPPFRVPESDLPESVEWDGRLGLGGEEVGEWIAVDESDMVSLEEMR